MSSATILVVDDRAPNIEAIEAILAPRGYAIVAASSGVEAIAAVDAHAPDLVLLDVIMPGMDGLEVCRRLRANPELAGLPIVLITATASDDKVRGLEVGADDFLTKPIDRSELLARVAAMLRMKQHQDTIQQQAKALAEWSRTLEQRVQEQMLELQRLDRLRRFLPDHLAELIISAEGESLLESHRRQIAVVCSRLAGFQAVVEAAAPEDVIALLRDYHECVGKSVSQHEGTVGPLVDDRVTVYFNDPLPVEDPAHRACAIALAMRNQMLPVLQEWRRRGLGLDWSAGIDLGYATLGTVGFAAKREYVPIGPVVHAATALCNLATAGQILVTQRVHSSVANGFTTGPLDEVWISELSRHVTRCELRECRVDSTNGHGTPDAVRGDVDPEPLTERELSVAALIADGLSNRDIAVHLVIAEATAVRHVANILSKLGFRSRAQVAAWAVRRAINGTL